MRQGLVGAHDAMRGVQPWTLATATEAAAVRRVCQLRRLWWSFEAGCHVRIG